MRQKSLYRLIGCAFDLCHSYPFTTTNLIGLAVHLYHRKFMMDLMNSQAINQDYNKRLMFLESYHIRLARKVLFLVAGTIRGFPDHSYLLLVSLSLLLCYLFS